MCVMIKKQNSQNFTDVEGVDLISVIVWDYLSVVYVPVLLCDRAAGLQLSSGFQTL